MSFLNFRFLFLSFVSLFLGIYFSLQLNALNTGYIVFASCLVLTICVCAVISKKIKAVICAIVFSFVGIVLGFTGYGNFYNNKINFNQTYNIEATVLNFLQKENQTYCLLGDCRVSGEKVGYNINLYIYGKSDVDYGQKISFNSELNKVLLFNLGKFNSNAYNNNVKATCTANVWEITLGEINHSYKTFIRAKLTNMFSDVSLQFVDVFRAIIMGDSWGIDQDIREVFSDGGISHLLAISGLHIMFLVAVLQFLLDKLKIKKKYSFCVICVLLGLYCFLCGFSNSVVRASIMSVCMLFAGVIGRKSDKLTNLGIAGLIILFAKPMSAFDLGFMLSFGSVLSIFLLNKPINNLLSKLHLPKNITNSISVMLSAQLGIIPILSLFYDSVNLFNLLSNLICVPIFSVAYILLMISVIIVCVMPFMKFMFALPEMLLAFITLIAATVQKISFLTINIKSYGAIFICSCIFCYFVLSEYVNASKLFKTAVCFAIMGICFVSLGISDAFLFPKINTVSCLSSQSDFHYVYKHNDRVFVVGKLDNNYNLKRFLKIQNINEIDYFIAIGAYNTIDFPIKNLITYDKESSNALKDYCNTFYVEKNQTLSLEDFIVEFITFNDSLNYVHFRLPDHNYLIINNPLKIEDYQKFYDLFEQEYELCGIRDECLSYAVFSDMKMLSVIIDNRIQNWSLYYDTKNSVIVRSLN